MCAFHAEKTINSLKVEMYEMGDWNFYVLVTLNIKYTYLYDYLFFEKMSSCMALFDAAFLLSFGKLYITPYFYPIEFSGNYHLVSS